jgi:hypothetical protein
MARKSLPAVERTSEGNFRVSVPPHASIDASDRRQRTVMCTLYDDGRHILGPVKVDLSDLRSIERAQMLAGALNGRVNWIVGFSALGKFISEAAEDAPANERADKRRPTMVTLSDVEPEAVEWLWEPYIPLSKPSFLEGDPGIGKTWLALAIASHVSRGTAWPESTTGADPADIVYLTAEDGLADTLRPRLDAAGADVRRVHVLTGWTSETDQGGVSLADIDVIEQAVKRFDAKLLVIDPLQAYLGRRVDMHRANETRPLLTALAAMALRCGCAVLIIRHLSKALQDRAIYRGLGSIDFAAAARSILLAAQDPQHPHQRVLAHAKSSLAKTGPSLTYEIREGQFLWAGQSELTADALIQPYPVEEERSATEEAQDFLRDFLVDGAKPAKEVIKEARKAGISERTLDRAKKGLVKARRANAIGESQGSGQWAWYLIDQERQDD